MNQNELSKKWNSLFDRSRDIKIGYVKEQCPICRTKNLKHFLDCKHIEMDLDEIDKRVKSLQKHNPHRLFLFSLYLNYSVVK